MTQRDTAVTKRDARSARDSSDDFFQWQKFKKGYPRGCYPESDFLLAEKLAQLRLDEGTTWDEIHAGCERFAAQQRALGAIGTQYVPSPKSFFDHLTRKWQDPFPMPAPKAKNSTEEPRWTPPVGDPKYDASLVKQRS